jgi:hypothetical protein
MQATYKIAHRGNLAIQTEVVDVPVQAAKAAFKVLDVTPGSYWHSNLAKPTRRAVREKRDTVRIYSAGFSTGTLANALAQVGCEMIYMGEI